MTEMGRSEMFQPRSLQWPLTRRRSQWDQLRNRCS